MPGLTWDDKCVKTSGGQNVKCMKWEAEKERCMDVACLVACEAKRAGSQSGALSNQKAALVRIFCVEIQPHSGWAAYIPPLCSSFTALRQLAAGS